MCCSKLLFIRQRCGEWRGTFFFEFSPLSLIRFGHYLSPASFPPPKKHQCLHNWILQKIVSLSLFRFSFNKFGKKQVVFWSKSNWHEAVFGFQIFSGTYSKASNSRPLTAKYLKNHALILKILVQHGWSKNFYTRMSFQIKRSLHFKPKCI